MEYLINTFSDYQKAEASASLGDTLTFTGDFMRGGPYPVIEGDRISRLMAISADLKRSEAENMG